MNDSDSMRSGARSGPRWWMLTLAGMVGAALALFGTRALESTDGAPPTGTPDEAAPTEAPKPLTAIEAEPARRMVVEVLTSAGVPARAVEHGRYPLRGGGQAVGTTLPLIGFTCPAGRSCDEVLSALGTTAERDGWQMVAARVSDQPGRPQYRALVREGRPALAIRAFPAGPRLTLIINDVGREPGLLDALLGLSPHVTYAVLANAPAATQVARRLTDADREVIAHLPMEPRPPETPDGPGFLTRQMAPAALKDAASLMLARVPGAAGVNAHLGSALTASMPHMGSLLGLLGERGLYYIDGRVAPDSVAGLAAQTMGVRTAPRTHYLDASGEPLPARLRAVEAALVLDGRAVVVAQPEPATLRALGPWLEGLARRQIHLLRASEIVL